MKQASESGWYEVRNVEEIPSPALLVYHDRMVENIRRMLAIAGAPGRLRPHVKTHKTGEIVRLQVEHGIRKCKCATIAEAEMAARNGATDILMAMQPVGPAVDRLLELKRQFSDAVFSTIVDAPEIVRRLGFASAASGFRTAVYVDINCGMNRTGIAPGEEAFQLYLEILRNPALEAAGLHVYDGHLREKDPARRRDLCDAAFAPVTALAERLRCAGLPVPAIVAGGTPSFPIHARRDDVELSPGTTVLWDETYRLGCPDLDFLFAALVLTRVVSKPAPTCSALTWDTRPSPRKCLTPASDSWDWKTPGSSCTARNIWSWNRPALLTGSGRPSVRGADPCLPYRRTLRQGLCRPRRTGGRRVEY